MIKPKSAGSTLRSDNIDILNFWIPQFNSTSEYSSPHGAEKAVGNTGYWCSEKYAQLPVYWWIQFKKSMEIVRIEFEEVYEGAEFEFFGCTDDDPSNNVTKLINGTSTDVNGKDFANGRPYDCYGLKFTKLGEKNFASIKNFQFHVLEGSIQDNLRLGSNSILDRSYLASSIYSPKYSADKAVEKKKYWCSSLLGSENTKDAWWRMDFKDKPVKITSISFDLRYVENFNFKLSGIADKNCSGSQESLINGTYAEVNKEEFVNTKVYYCYLLSIERMDDKDTCYATLKNFDFLYKDDSAQPITNQSMSVSGVEGASNDGDKDGSRQSSNGYPTVYGTKKFHHFTLTVVKASFDLYRNSSKRRNYIWRKFSEAGRRPRFVAIGKFYPWAWMWNTYYTIANYKGSHALIIFEK